MGAFLLLDLWYYLLAKHQLSCGYLMMSGCHVTGVKRLKSILKIRPKNIFAVGAVLGIGPSSMHHRKIFSHYTLPLQLTL